MKDGNLEYDSHKNIFVTYTFYFDPAYYSEEAIKNIRETGFGNRNPNSTSTELPEDPSSPSSTRTDGDEVIEETTSSGDDTQDEGTDTDTETGEAEPQETVTLGAQ